MNVTSKITRREFLNGSRVALAGGLLCPWVELFGAPVAAPGLANYPPELTGMRGTHDGAWENVHALVAAGSWQGPVPASDEHYDLVVVGGGISGLSAAWFYRQEHPGARVLVLDNHDDIGGHAKRNEFTQAGRLLIGYGGTQSIDTPSSFSPQAQGLLRDIGIQTEKFYQYFDREFYTGKGLGNGVFFDRETFGVDRLVTGLHKRSWEDVAADTPLGDQAKKDLVRLYSGTGDYFQGQNKASARASLSGVSYADFLLKIARVDPSLVQYFDRQGLSFWGYGIRDLPCDEVLRWGGFFPGLDSIREDTSRHGEDPYIFHFPDGNASVARLLVRGLVPGALPGQSMEDSVLSRLRYDVLDRPAQDVRIRLNSTVVRATNDEDGKTVSLVYLEQGKARSVTADGCVLACYNSVIPYLCPELPESQREALLYAPKIPLVYVNVLLRNWKAFEQLAVHEISAPGSFFSHVTLDFPVSMGGYEHPAAPDQPMLLHLVHVPYAPEVPGKDKIKAGRRKLLALDFDDFEQELRDQLGRMLGDAGFEFDRDVKAITVNRWPHGYAYEGNSLWDPVFDTEQDKPWVRGRARVGRISIANSDAQAFAYTDAAIDQAWRAVSELG
ncbi:MAG: NAD(P)/FAD-dependent oxidoreductase [Gammaproteobacteria bacterium]|nr:NAD(P)/FAD-dependent oxidoreductase [Gammaproteobacteria bacterium]